MNIKQITYIFIILNYIKYKAINIKISINIIIKQTLQSSAHLTNLSPTRLKRFYHNISHNSPQHSLRHHIPEALLAHFIHKRNIPAARSALWFTHNIQKSFTNTVSFQPTARLEMLCFNDLGHCDWQVGGVYWLM